MRENFEIRFGGSGGQGLQLSAKLLADALNHEGCKVARSQSYEPTSRGGLSRADLVVAADSIDYPLITALDFLVLLDQPPVAISLPLLNPDALVIADARRVTDLPARDYDVHLLPLSETALALGNERVTNIVALGVFAGLSKVCAFGTLEQAVRDGVPPRFLDLNLRSFARGVKLSETIESALI
ncbi:MAG: 2-oxoacid:acceptor oxidoreductase family protein [Paracoccaceae bacterium]